MAQMYDNELQGLKGFYPGQPWVVDKTLPVESGVTVLAGQVVHIKSDSSGGFVWGLGSGTTGNTSAPIPFLAMQNSTDFDVVGDIGTDGTYNIVGAERGANDAAAGVSQPNLSALACTFAAEVEVNSSAFDAAALTTGDLLVSGVDGKLEKKGTSIPSGSGVTVCGVVSDCSVDASGNSTVTNPQDGTINVLRFHTCYLPVVDWTVTP